MSTGRRNRERINVTVDPDALARARRYARATGQSLSGLVSSFLGRLPDPSDDVFSELDPSFRRFHGVLRGRGDEADWKAHLVERHLGTRSGGDR